MTEVQIKFSERNKNAILYGNKRCTSCREEKAKVNDHFVIEGKNYQIKEIMPHELGYVANFLYIDEGYESPEAFITDWKKLHRGHYNPDKTVYVHFFENVDHMVLT